MQLDIERHGQGGKATMVLAHGAGAGMGSDFMVAFAEGLASRDIETILFNFPYMQKRAEDGKKRPPDRAPKLLECYRQVLDSVSNNGPLFIGGKSMGGRIASMLLAEDNGVADGLVLLGYPFAPPGKPEKLRVDHFPDIQKPTLILQGERDVFGGRPFVESLSLPDNFEVTWLPDGDHSFKPRKASGSTEQGNWQLAIERVSSYVAAYRAG